MRSTYRWRAPSPARLAPAVATPSLTRTSCKKPCASWASTMSPASSSTTSVRVLDGGLAAWRESGHPTTTDVPTPRRGTVTLHPGATAFLDDVAAGHWAGSGRLLDVRTPERYRGEVEPIDPIAGRIPGAINLPMGLMMQADGTFRTPEEIRNAAAGAGIDLTSPVGTSCGSGITAAQMVLALHEAGIDAVPYIGSWSNQPSNPIDRPIDDVPPQNLPGLVRR